MAFDVDRAASQLAYEGRWLFTLAQRVLRMSDTITKSAAKIERLSAVIRDLQASETLAIARMEAAVTRAAADATGDLSRRLGYFEGRASRD